MNTLILDGAGTLRDLARNVAATLGAELARRGARSTLRDLTALSVPDCNGDFGCWTTTPGVCVQPGPHREIGADIIRSDTLVFLTPLTFGGYSSPLKRVLDHQIPLLSPFFATIEGETHHPPRYARFPDLVALGLAERWDEEGAAVFERLVRRNALNMSVRHVVVRLVVQEESHGLARLVSDCLDDLRSAPPPAVALPPLDLSPDRDLPPTAPHRAWIINGSPRGSAGTSARLTSYLESRLTARGLSVTVMNARGLQHDEGQIAALLESLHDDDLLVFAAPLYVDSLPAPLTAVLERLAERRAAKAGHGRPRVLAIVNNGFPEAVHDDTALAICRCFAHQTGMAWTGGLAIGGGGMYGGRPLDQQGGRARGLVRALDVTAAAVAAGSVVPAEADRLARRLSIPRWLYRLMANWSFRSQARRHGVGARMRDRPYS